MHMSWNYHRQTGGGRRRPAPGGTGKGTDMPAACFTTLRPLPAFARLEAGRFNFPMGREEERKRGREGRRRRNGTAQPAENLPGPAPGRQPSCPGLREHARQQQDRHDLCPTSPALLCRQDRQNWGSCVPKGLLRDFWTDSLLPAGAGLPQDRDNLPACHGFYRDSLNPLPGVPGHEQALTPKPGQGHELFQLWQNFTSAAMVYHLLPPL